MRRPPAYGPVGSRSSGPLTGEPSPEADAVLVVRVLGWLEQQAGQLPGRRALRDGGQPLCVLAMNEFGPFGLGELTRALDLIAQLGLVAFEEVDRPEPGQRGPDGGLAHLHGLRVLARGGRRP